MHITVIDYKIIDEEREKYHISNFERLSIREFILKESINVDTIKDLDTDILLVHKSNPEFNQIESSNHFGKIRIFFSEGFHTDEYKYDGYNYYVAYKHLYETLLSLISQRVSDN